MVCIKLWWMACVVYLEIVAHLYMLSLKNLESFFGEVRAHLVKSKNLRIFVWTKTANSVKERAVFSRPGRGKRPFGFPYPHLRSVRFPKGHGCLKRNLFKFIQWSLVVYASSGE